MKTPDEIEHDLRMKEYRVLHWELHGMLPKNTEVSPMEDSFVVGDLYKWDRTPDGRYSLESNTPEFAL